MELRQFRYFVRVIELGSMGRAAVDLGVVTSALSQQISRLEGELSTRLLQRTSSGVVPTDAGIAFFQQAQLALRHVEEAARAAQQARLSGHVSIGLASSTAGVLGLPLLRAMRQRYSAVRLHLVESLSVHLAAMLNARQLDLAVLFETMSGRRWSVMPLLTERLFVIGLPHLVGMPKGSSVRLAQLGDLPFILPSVAKGLRVNVDLAFARAGVEPHIVAEIDSLATLMSAVHAGLGATIQPGAATLNLTGEDLAMIPLADADAHRSSLLASLSDDELSPAALAARVVLMDVTKGLIAEGNWPGATLLEA